MYGMFTVLFCEPLVNICPLEDNQLKTTFVFTPGKLFLKVNFVPWFTSTELRWLFFYRPLIIRCIELTKYQCVEPEGSEDNNTKVLGEVISNKLDAIQQAVSHALKKLEVITKEDNSSSLLNSSGSNTSGSSNDCLTPKLEKLSVWHIGVS